MIFKSIIIIFGILLHSSVNAMNFIRYEDTLVMSGDIEESDIDKFSRFSGIKHVALKNSPGGNLKASIEIGYMIRDAGIITSVSGYCYSGCAMIFLGGIERSMEKKAILGFHGCKSGENYVGQIDALLISYADFMTSGKFTGSIAAATFFELKNNNLLIFQDGKASFLKNGNLSRLETNARELGIIT